MSACGPGIVELCCNLDIYECPTVQMIIGSVGYQHLFQSGGITYRTKKGLSGTITANRWTRDWTDVDSEYHYPITYEDPITAAEMEADAWTLAYGANFEDLQVPEPGQTIKAWPQFNAQGGISGISYSGPQVSLPMEAGGDVWWPRRATPRDAYWTKECPCAGHSWRGTMPYTAFVVARLRIFGVGRVCRVDHTLNAQGDVEISCTEHDAGTVTIEPIRILLPLVENSWLENRSCVYDESDGLAKRCSSMGDWIWPRPLLP